MTHKGTIMWVQTQASKPARASEGGEGPHLEKIESQRGQGSAVGGISELKDIERPAVGSLLQQT